MMSEEEIPGREGEPEAPSTKAEDVVKTWTWGPGRGHVGKIARNALGGGNPARRTRGAFLQTKGMAHHLEGERAAIVNNL